MTPHFPRLTQAGTSYPVLAGRYDELIYLQTLKRIIIWFLIMSHDISFQVPLLLIISQYFNPEDTLRLQTSFPRTYGHEHCSSTFTQALHGWITPNEKRNLLQSTQWLSEMTSDGLTDQPHTSTAFLTKISDINVQKLNKLVSHICVGDVLKERLETIPSQIH